jgi:son of sevenless
MSYWVATEIVLAPANESHKVIERMIQIAVHLCELRNFNTLIATVAGLNLSAVARLKDAWSRVGKASVGSFQELTELCNPISNYRQYREAFKSVQPPAVPYIALYLHDLTFIEDGNLDYLDGEAKSVINFAKMRMIANVFLAIEKFQRVEFNLQHVQTILGKQN